jgi:hypothetical protein
MLILNRTLQKKHDLLQRELVAIPIFTLKIFQLQIVPRINIQCRSDKSHSEN